MKIQNIHKNYSVRGKIILMVAILALYSTACGASPTAPPATENLQVSSATSAASATPLLLPSITPKPTATAICSILVPSQTSTLPPQQYFTEISQDWRVAFFNGDSNEICTMNGDGSDKTCLALSDENISEGFSIGGFFDLSPDGTKVAYATHCNIYLWTIGGDVASLRDRSGCPSFRELKWSPDGNFIAYISEEMYRIGPQAYFGDVFVDSLDGKVHRALTADLVGWSYDPDWSPDGRSIAFTHQSVIGDIQSQNSYALAEEIFVVSTDGNKALNFTNHSAADVKPRWSPDGSLIVFLSNRRGGELFDLYVMNSNGSEVRMVAALGLEYMWPYSSYPITWLPDNKSILYNNSLYDIRTGQSDVIRLPFESIHSSWRMIPEGVRIDLTSNCAKEWSHLRPGVQAVVAGGPNDQPNRVRSAPSVSADIIAQIYPGHTVRVLAGPVCAEGVVFWKVESEAIPGGIGWTAEGDGKEYWLEP